MHCQQHFTFSPDSVVKYYHADLLDIFCDFVTIATTGMIAKISVNIAATNSSVQVASLVTVKISSKPNRPYPKDSFQHLP